MASRARQVGLRAGGAAVSAGRVAWREVAGLSCAQGHGVGRMLLTPVLQRAGQEGLPCYLETFVPENVRFYEHRGFNVVDAGAEPRSQSRFSAVGRGSHR